MKIFLSRKSFDSGAGGKPSIIYNNKLIPIPIPQIIRGTEYDSGKKYNDLFIHEDSKIQDIFSDLYSNQKGRFMHLDPDLRKDSVNNRSKGWKPSLGQIGTSQSILEKAEIAVGDLFLFFGWFKEVVLKEDGKFTFKNDAKDLHVIYGYLKIGEIIKSDAINLGNLPNWIKDEHPHFKLKHTFGEKYTNNTIYVADDQLGSISDKPGAGIFNINDNLILTDTDPNNNKRSQWKISDVFKKDIEIATILNGNKERIKEHNSPYIIVDAKVGQGQEYPIKDNVNGDAKKWALDLIEKSSLY